VVARAGYGRKREHEPSMAWICSDGDTDEDGHERRPAKPPTDPKRRDAKVELEACRQIAGRHRA
jgi:hypothetical protein